MLHVGLVYGLLNRNSLFLFVIHIITILLIRLIAHVITDSHFTTQKCGTFTPVQPPRLSNTPENNSTTIAPQLR